MHTEKFKEYYSLLNGEQRTAVDAVDGPLLVLAGPGTGKTQLLAVRAANILNKKKVDPENVLILTFTNAATRAMRERLAIIMGHEGYNVTVETFHSFSNSIVLESEAAIAYVKEKIEIGEIEKVRALEYILDNVRGAEGLRPFGAPYIHRKEIEKRISELKNEGISPGKFLSELKGIVPDGINVEDKHVSRLKSLSVIYEKYEKLKDEECGVLFDDRGRLDYDDMILLAIDALKNDKGLCRGFRDQYKYIMVDEYQDTNGAQLELLFSILDPASSNICCVGDDDQAIYRFQGATLSNFRLLKEKLPALKTISLRDNYRSTQEIADISGSIISGLPPAERITAKELKSKKDYSSGKVSITEFSTEEEELGFIVKEISRCADLIKKDECLSREEREKPFNNIAILVRKRAHILKVIDALLKAGIPYATDGAEDIRSEKRVRQILDVLELAACGSEDQQKRSLLLYRVLTSDYIGALHSDVLSFMGYVLSAKTSASDHGSANNAKFGLFQQFQECFGRFGEDDDGMCLRPSEKDSAGLRITEELKLKRPHALHTAAWAVGKMISDGNSRPVHDLIMRYIEDSGIYRFILERYSRDKVIRIRELRSLVSFINMVKKADLADPALNLDEFMEEMEMREIHGMPVQGELATLTQDGVRVYTAHKAKGLEFYAVFLPFCLQQKSWPLRRKPDVVPLPYSIYKSKERVDEKKKVKLLDLYDELRLFYVASTRAKAHLIYTSAPAEKVITSPFLGYIDTEVLQGSPQDEEKFLREYLSTDREDDLFAGTEDVLKDIIEGITLNPTSLNNYIACRRKFLYDNVLRLPGKKNQHLIFGNCAHKALEDVYGVLMEKGVFPGFERFKKVFILEFEYQGANKEIRTWCLDRLETLKDWYKIEEKFPVVPVALENKLEITLPGGLSFRGTFDKIEEEGKDEIRVVDYKTGKPDKHVKKMALKKDISSHACDDYYRQLVAYKLLYERSSKTKGKGTVSRGVLQFLEPVGDTVQKYGLEKGEYKKITVDLTDDMVVELEKVILDRWNDIRSLKFEKLPERDGNERCRNCEYDNICWEK
ncbi:MAG: ATP-dependent DNA helicase [Candidatus Omnitrophota bacterium]|nr:ATP-dependent helicase [Candidatus Omnitrophota bacterium]